MYTVLIVCSLALILCFGFPLSAHAYLDPGTGSYIFQLLIAGLVGIGFVVKVYWKRIRSFFAGGAPQDEETDAVKDKDG
jgi:hypothetical protein